MSERVVVPVPSPRVLENAALVALVDVSAIERGARVIAAAPGRVERDLRVWITPQPGTDIVRLVTERGWWEFVLQGLLPEIVDWPVGAAWIERDPVL